MLFTFTKKGDKGYDVPRDQSEIDEKREKATAIYNRIISGERTFESYVYMSEDDEGSTAGFLVTHGDLITALDNSVFDMAVGEIKMIESRMGLHIVKKDVPSETDFQTYKENVTYVISGKDFDELQEKYISQIVTNEKAKNMYDFYKII